MKSKLLPPLYNRVIQGVPVLGTPEETARRFAEEGGTPEAYGARVVALYVSLCGATGFVCGLPGFLLLPVTLPANVVGVAALQLHMCATLAVLGGRDVHDAATRDRCVGCLLEKINERRKNTEEEEVASRAGVKLAERGVRFVLEKAATYSMKAARNVALRKLGVRRLPLVGGVLGASSDAYVTTHIGRCAQDAFLDT